MIQRSKEKPRRADDDSSEEDSDDSAGRRVPHKSRNDDAREEQEVLRALIGGRDAAQPGAPVKRGRGRPRKYPRPEEISASEARRRAEEEAMARELDALEAQSDGTTSFNDDVVPEDDFEITSPPSSVAKRPKSLPPPPAPKLFGFQPNPAMFAAKKLRGPVMVLREEISDIEEVEEDEEDDDKDVDRMDVDDISLEWKRPPVVAWMPQEQDDATINQHSFVRRPEQRAGQKRSRQPSSDDEHVQTVVQRTFGLWRAGNPQSFASEKRRIDPTVDLSDEDSHWIPKAGRGAESPEGTPPPDTPKSKGLYPPLGNAAIRSSRLDLYQRPRSHSVGNMLLQKELETAAKRAAANAVRRHNPTPLVKSRLQHSTYATQSRSYVKLPTPSVEPIENRSKSKREEETWLKAQKRRVSSRSLSPDVVDSLWIGQRQKSMISLPLYDSEGEDVNLEVNEDEYDVEGEHVLGAHGELEDEEVLKAGSDQSMHSEVESPTVTPRRSSRRRGKGGQLDIPAYSQPEDDMRDESVMGVNGKVLGAISPQPKQTRRDQVSYSFPSYLSHNLRLLSPLQCQSADVDTNTQPPPRRSRRTIAAV